MKKKNNTFEKQKSLNLSIGASHVLFRNFQLYSKCIHQTTMYLPNLKGVESPMLREILTSVVAPIIVGIVVALFDDWLERRRNNKK